MPNMLFASNIYTVMLIFERKLEEVVSILTSRALGSELYNTTMW